MKESLLDKEGLNRCALGAVVNYRLCRDDVQTGAPHASKAPDRLQL